MRKGLIILSALMVILNLSSCRSNRDLVYLRDVDGQESQLGKSNVVPEYRLKTNDNLYVNIQSLNSEVNQLFNPSFGDGYRTGTQQMYGQLSSQYLNGYQVDVQGNITLPVMGKIHVADLTMSETQLLIQDKANEYLNEATVKVKLLNYKVTVLGEVRTPGVYYNYNNEISVLEAISMANGITDFGQIKRVLVIRPTPEGNKSYRLDLSNRKLLSSDGFFLQPNDVVYVEPARYKNTNLNIPVYSLFLSSVSTLILILSFMNN